MRVVVRGGGDLASGTVYKLFQCGFEVVILECEKPTSIRRYVSFSEAVYHGSSKVEGVICKKANSLDLSLIHIFRRVLGILEPLYLY